jgi:3-methyladenine DNA glycosylase AlkD
VETVASELAEAIRDALAAAAEPAKAGPMQAYMKSTMPFRGIQAPRQRRIAREVVSAHPLASFDAWCQVSLELWREARHREERYMAIALAMQRRYREYAERLEAMSLYEDLIVTGAWWDLVDSVAVHLVGGLLRLHPEPMRRVTLAWAQGEDRWLRRAAIICQNSFGRDTDAKLLYACIEPSLGERDFFLRKAIGWALREYAKANPDAARRYATAHELSPLSRREALRNIRSPS